MSLTRRQQWRIKKIQSERIARIQRAAKSNNNITNDKTSECFGLVITRYGQRLLVESESGDIFQCTGRQNIELSVAGDQVIFQPINEKEGVVTALVKRDNQLERSHKIIASNIDQLWLVVATEPHYQFEMIDSYLIVAEYSNLPINIIVNKVELNNNQKRLEKDFSIYTEIGYSVVYISVKEQTNLGILKSMLDDKSHIFLGQSGVGKSSLINELIPELNLRVKEISKKSKLGKHTTTNTTLYHIPSGGDLIDSPGIREFQLDNLTNKQILNGFIEFKPFIGSCKYRNCVHINEPDCAIKNAINTGQINHKRYQNYLNLISK